MPIYTARSMARAEEEIISRYTLSPEILMEHAGFSMASRIGQFCRERKPASVDILCGTGHNGGDGYVIARALSQKGFSVRLFTAGGRLKPLTAVNRQRCECLGIACNPIETFNPTAGVVVVDALFGIGLNRPLSSLWKDLFERIRTAKVPVIAVDTPSGLFEERKSDDPILGADLTLTVEYPKREFPLRERGTGSAAVYAQRPALCLSGGATNGPLGGNGKCAISQNGAYTPPGRQPGAMLQRCV